MTNKELMLLVEGKDAVVGLDGITALINLIVRDWIPTEDIAKLRSCKGIALDKGNHQADAFDIRPICVGEAIISLADSYVLEMLKPHLMKLAGVKEGFQIGLTSEGIFVNNRQAQISFDVDELTGAITHVTVKLDVRNAFNTLSRATIRQVIRNSGKFENYMLHQYSHDAKVDFGGGISTTMKTGTQQGGKTSALIFDVALYQQLKNDKIFEDFKDCRINAIHDDITYKAPIGRAYELFDRLSTSLLKIGLEVNPLKTAILYRGNAQDVDALRPLLEKTAPHMISNEGFAFGGFPIGSDKYKEEFLREYAQLVAAV